MLVRRVVLLAALVAASLVAAAPGLATPVAATPLRPAAAGRVNVVATYAGQPVGQLAVLINNSASNPNPVDNFDGHNFTGADGRYARDVPPGNYDVHVAEYPGNNVTYGSQVVYEVAVPDGGVVDLAFELDQPWGAITGLVSNPDGSPAANVQVDVFATSALGDQPPYGWGSTRTTAEGWYRINLLRPNSYYVLFAPELGYRVEGAPVQAGHTTVGGDLPNPVSFVPTPM